MMINYAELSRAVSHALRHNPEHYSIELDSEGWISISELVNSLRQNRVDFKDLTKSDIDAMVRNATKKRHEIRHDLIRAMYGHSKDVEVKYLLKQPPTLLFHGTARTSVFPIMVHGLRPMERLYVHLSENIETAAEVGRRKHSNNAILRIQALSAHSDGIEFYFANDKTWLAKTIPPNYIELIQDNES